jgi:hypothetical protein
MSLAMVGEDYQSSLFMFLVITFAGVSAFAVLISWRAQVLFNAEYVDVVIAHHQPQKPPQRGDKRIPLVPLQQVDY